MSAGIELPAELLDLIEKRAREIAREEIASLCGLVMRRVQDMDSLGDYAENQMLASIFGEALRDFGATTDEPGPTR
jgi:hypothetical protein